MECVRLRVKDVDFQRKQITVRDGKGMKDRSTMLPGQLEPFLLEHLSRVKIIHEHDLQKGLGEVYLPFALERKYPKAAREWGWQYLFPSERMAVDPRSGKVRRHHLNESGLQKAVRTAGRTLCALQSQLVLTPFATALLHTCWSPVRTLERYRNCSVTRTFRPP